MQPSEVLRRLATRVLADLATTDADDAERRVNRALAVNRGGTGRHARARAVQHVNTGQNVREARAGSGAAGEDGPARPETGPAGP